MSTKDRFVGKAKEVAGKATGDDKLTSEGRAQHAKGKVTETVEEARDTAAGTAEAAKEAVSKDEDSGEDSGDDTRA